jgi:hypothetical protein
MRRLTGVALVLALALGAAGCDSDEPPTSTTPTTPTVPVTETFGGSLNTNGGLSFSFQATAAGVVTATLKTVSPDNAIEIGLALGTWNGVTCQIVLANDKAKQAITVTGNVSTAGALCVRVYDVGQVTQLTTVEVVVVHP